jgi:hypothetical protein
MKLLLIFSQQPFIRLPFQHALAYMYLCIYVRESLHKNSIFLFMLAKNILKDLWFLEMGKLFHEIKN